jgi:hypothetical protein
MSVVLAKELRMELHYGIDFIGKAVEDGPNKTGAIGKLIEARAAMGSYISALENKNYFIGTMRGAASNNVIEMDPDVVDDDALPKDVSPSVQEIKACIAGISLGLEKVMKIRFSPQIPMVPVNSYKALRSVDRVVDSLEGCIGYLHNELQDISKRNPGVYPTFEVEEKTPDEIKVELNIYGHDIGLTNNEFDEWLKKGGKLYKIIIPQEEHKKFGDYIEKSINIMSIANSMFGAKEEPKQLTDLEVAIKLEEIQREEPKQDYIKVHLRHCYQGEYEDGCKYGENDCPAKLLEHKQETCEFMKEVGCIKDICTCNTGPKQGTMSEAIKQVIDNQLKQETVEEAAKSYAGIPITRDIDEEERYYCANIKEYDAFKAGVKWQAERMYSEENMINFAHFYFKEEYNLYMMEINKTTKELLSELFEQFKKK